MERKHKGLFLKQPKVLTLEEFPTPIPSDEAVLLKVLSVGICHSDLHRWKGEMPCPTDGWRIGAGTHEVVGKVEAKGEKVPNSIQEGQKFLVYFLAQPKVDDKYTRRGLMHHAVTPFTDIWFTGGMQEYLLLHNYRCLVSVEGLRDIYAAPPLACAALTSYGAVKKLKMYVEPEDYVAVIGLGGLGLYALQWVKNFYPYVNLVGIDIRDEVLEYAPKIAKVDVTINAMKEDPVKVLNELTKGEGAKAFIDFVGSTKTVGTYIKAISHFGIYVLVGTMGNEVLLPEAPLFAAKECCFQGSFMGTLQDQYEVVEFARKEKIDYSKVVTRRIRFDPIEVNRAFQELDEGKVIGRQVVIFNKS